MERTCRHVEKRIRFNDHEWIELPLPAGTPERPEIFAAALNESATEVPIEHLLDGLNQFALTCSPQVIYQHGYPAFAAYGITVRVYYDAKVAHAQAKIVSPRSGEAIGDNPANEVEIENSAGFMACALFVYGGHWVKSYSAQT